MIFRPRLWGFWDFCENLWKFWVGLCCSNVICSCIAFSLYYNNGSCILDVCLTIVDRVLVGLDWVCTHNAFIFCMSHVNAFFMHMSFPFYTLFLSCECVLFSLSLSLSLSWIDCTMAPKVHKSTPAQNPLSFRSSFSDLIPPLHIQFCDEKARKDFLENFQKRGR